MFTFWGWVVTLIYGALTGAAATNPVITAAPPNPFRDSLHRRAIDTCGYVSGNPGLPKTCNAPYTCTCPNLMGLPFMDCCNEVECAPGDGARTCVGHDSGDCQGEISSGVCETVYTSILFCTDLASPACVTYFRTASTEMFGDSNPTISFGCGKSSAEIPLLATPTKRGESPATLTSSSDALSSRIGAVDPTTSSSTYKPLVLIRAAYKKELTAEELDLGTDPGTTSPTSPTSPSNSTSHLFSTLAIVGIVIGAIIAITAIGILIWCCCRRRERQKQKHQQYQRPWDCQSLSAGTAWGTSESGASVMQWLDRQGRVRH